jgi:hypothetical protein
MTVGLATPGAAPDFEISRCPNQTRSGVPSAFLLPRLTERQRVGSGRFLELRPIEVRARV